DCTGRTFERRGQARSRSRGVAQRGRAARAPRQANATHGDHAMRSNLDSRSSVARFACRVGVSASVLTLVGCASLAGVGGSAQFGCKAPVGVQCDSVSGTYYNALQQNLPSQQKSPPEASAAPTVMDQLAGKRVIPAAYSGNG